MNSELAEIDTRIAAIRLDVMAGELTRVADEIEAAHPSRADYLRSLVQGYRADSGHAERLHPPAHAAHVVGDMMAVQLEAVADAVDEGEPVDTDLCRHLAGVWEQHRPRAERRA